VVPQSRRAGRIDAVDTMYNPEEQKKYIDGILAGCERQAEAWQKIQPDKWEINDPFKSEKSRISYVMLGYIGRMLELYYDSRGVFDEEKYLSGVILARAFVESAAMTCLFHEQMKKHFYPRPSADCKQILEKHMSGARHEIDDREGQTPTYNILDAIGKANTFAINVDKQLAYHLSINDNIDVIVPGAKPTDHRIVKKMGKFGWIYSILSEFSHPNPVNSGRYFGSDWEFLSDLSMKLFIAEGLSTMIYAGVATNTLMTVLGVRETKDERLEK